MTASLALGHINAPESVPALIRLLGSKDPWARRAAAHAFETGKLVTGVEALVKALADPDEDVVDLAILALKEIGPAAAAAIPALERIRKKESRGYARVLAREALEKIGKK